MIRCACPRFVVTFYANRCGWIRPVPDEHEGAELPDVAYAFGPQDPTHAADVRAFRCATVDDLYDVLRAFPMELWAMRWERLSATTLRAWLARTTSDGRARTRIGAIYMLAPAARPVVVARRGRRPLLVHGVDEIAGWEA